MKEKRNKKQKNFSVFITHVIAIPLGALLGYWLCQLAMTFFSGSLADVSADMKLVILLCSAALFAVLFFISAPAFLEFIVNIGFAIEKKLAKYSSKDIAAGMIGLLFGLMIAFLVSNLINLIPIEPVAMLLTVITYCLLGTLGIVLGTRKLKEIVIVNDKTEPGSISVKLIDTSALIDGRILQLAKTKFIDGKLLVPKFVLDELHALADSDDNQKRQKGRRGLDIIASMQADDDINVSISDHDYENDSDVDAKLIRLATGLKAKIITLDYNLNKAASILDIGVLNINELVAALKPTISVGDIFEVEILKHGKDKSQGVGYMPDGTMVVIENGGNAIGKTMTVIVTSNIQTNAGKIIFTRI